jgi:hypothetical protein
MKDWQSNLSLLNWSVLGEDGWVVELSLQKVKGHHEMCTAIHPPTSNTHHPDNLFFFLFFFPRMRIFFKPHRAPWSFPPFISLLLYSKVEEQRETCGKLGYFEGAR